MTTTLRNRTGSPDAHHANAATVSGDAQALTSALFELAGGRVALLDPELVFTRLRRAFA